MMMMMMTMMNNNDDIGDDDGDGGGGGGGGSSSSSNSSSGGGDGGGGGGGDHNHDILDNNSVKTDNNKAPVCITFSFFFTFFFSFFFSLAAQLEPWRSPFWWDFCVCDRLATVQIVPLPASVRGTDWIGLWEMQLKGQPRYEDRGNKEQQKAEKQRMKYTQRKK